jgi:hypothetical protein
MRFLSEIAVLTDIYSRSPEIIECAPSAIVIETRNNYGFDPRRTKYFLDDRGQVTRKSPPYMGMNVYLVLRAGNALYLIGSDDEGLEPGRAATSTILRWRLAPDETPQGEPALIEEIEKRPIPLIKTADARADGVLLRSDRTAFRLRGDRWSVFPNKAAGDFLYNSGRWDLDGMTPPTFYHPRYIMRRHRFSLALPDESGRGGRNRAELFARSQRIAAPGGGHAGSGVYLGLNPDTEFFPLPMPSCERIRESGNTPCDEDRGNVDNWIGPIQPKAGKLWFATTFYAGEGSTGIGGVGYFDPTLREYRIDYPRELARRSASALLVEDPNNIWIGSKTRPEGADAPMGLVHFDSTRKTARVHPVPAHIRVIRRSGDKLILGTSDGVVTLSREGAREWIRFDPRPDGGYRLVREPSPRANGRRQGADGGEGEP